MQPSRTPPLTQWPALGFSRFRELLRQASQARTVGLATVALLLIDGAWIAWYFFAGMTYEAGGDPRWYEMRQLRITTENSIPEIYNYVKTAVLVGVLTHIAVLRPQWIYKVLVILFGFVLLDDSLGIHEAGGEYFVDMFLLEDSDALRAQDVGELITWSVVGVVLAPLLLFSLLRAPKRDLANGLALLIPFGALLFFAMVVDQLYIAHRDQFFGAGIVIDTVEDGGEMLAITVSFAIAAAMARKRA